LAPGPGMLYVISRGLTGGRRAGLIAAMGTSLGIAVHIVAATFGVSVVVEATEIGFQLLKWAGVAYLLFLAWKSLWRPDEILKERDRPGQNRASVFWQGALVNVLNPKVALFFLAFLPQFTSTGSAAIGSQMAVLGATFMAVTAIVFTGYGISAGTMRRWLVNRPSLKRLLDRATAGLFVALGLRLALSER
ncbi:MAG: LysE family translocator, partial [Planctomycetota bacterium]